MAIQGRGDANGHSGNSRLNFRHDSRQVPLQVQSQGQEIGHHENSPGSSGNQTFHGPTKVRFAAFEEARFSYSR